MHFIMPYDINLEYKYKSVIVFVHTSSMIRKAEVACHSDELPVILLTHVKEMIRLMLRMKHTTYLAKAYITE